MRFIISHSDIISKLTGQILRDAGIGVVLLSLASGCSSEGYVIYTADWKRKEILCIDPLTGIQTTVSSDGSLRHPGGLALDSQGRILVADREAFDGNGGVIRVDPQTGAQTTVSSGGSFRDPMAIAVDADGKILVVDVSAFGGHGGIIRVDPLTGRQETVSSGVFFRGPGAITLDRKGNIFVADSDTFPTAFDNADNLIGNAGVIRVDPITGAQFNITSHGALSVTNDIVLDPHGMLLVAEAMGPDDLGAIIRVDPTTGTTGILSSGGSLEGLSAIEIGFITRRSYWPRRSGREIPARCPSQK
jgi:sugar lactone lactonase YvrE